LMRDPNALRGGHMPSSGRRGHYDPNQPRVPAGRRRPVDRDRQHRRRFQPWR
jgi:hypothetical protein